MVGVDLATPPFWIFVGLAIAIMPGCRGRVRPVVWALLCLGLLAMVLEDRLSGDWTVIGFDLALFVIVPLCLLHLGLVAVDRMEGTRDRILAGVVVGLGVGAVFVLHKRPDLGAVRAGDLTPVLAVLGFSYVALRAVDLLRALVQRRVSRPSMAQLVGYLVPIHMLAAGPIAPAEEALAAGPPPAPDTRAALEGVERIAAGLFKKFVLAGLLREVMLTDFTAEGAYLVLEVQLFYVWVYLDFSALSDIAVGVGRLCGMPAPENFDRPLTARNLIVFWERWHITLSQFARRNIFVPLQLWLVRRGGGKSPVRVAAVALAVTFVAIGLWHGLSLGFLAWGAMHAAGVVACHLWQQRIRKRGGAKALRAYLARPGIRVVATIVTFEYVALSLALVKALWMGGT